MDIATGKIALPDFTNKLDEYKKSRLAEILNKVYGDRNFEGILWSGSMAYKKDLTRSDADLVCLTKDIAQAEASIKNDWINLSEVDVVLDQGSFPWLGRTYTIYFKESLDFSVDIGLVEESAAPKFFWQPSGFIVFDRFGKISDFLKAQKENPSFTFQSHPNNIKRHPFTQAVISIKKIEKDLSRGHLWDALYIMNLLRRYVMQIIRIYEMKDKNFGSRVDKDIEDILSPETNKALSETVAIYDSTDIATKTAKLAGMLEFLVRHSVESGEKHLQEWILKQIKHEHQKLKTYGTK